MSARIQIARSEIDRLRAVVEQNTEGRDAVAAERLAAELDSAVLVDEVPPGVVALGSRVRFEDVRTGNVREALLVYPTAVAPPPGRLSVLAPIGAALLGLSVGDVIAWPLPDGREARIRILSVEVPSAAAEHASL